MFTGSFSSAPKLLPVVKLAHMHICQYALEELKHLTWLFHLLTQITYAVLVWLKIF